VEIEVADLKHVAAYADLGLQLQGCNFIDHEVTKLSLQIHGNTARAELASDEHLRSWLLPLRQMISNGEPTNYKRIHKLIAKYAPHDLAMKHANHVKDRVGREMSEWFPKHDPPYPEKPEKFIVHFFNGEYFHDKSTKKSKPHRDAIEAWYQQVGYEKTHWEFQVKVWNVGQLLLQHSYSAVAAARYIIHQHGIEADLPISIECARLLGIKQKKPSITRGSLYEDEEQYETRFKRTLEHGFDQLKAFLDAANLIEFVSNVKPEKPLTISSLLRVNRVNFDESDAEIAAGYSRFGTIVNRNLGRLSGSWRYGPQVGYIFCEDALLLLDIALSECRALAARPRKLTSRIEHIHNTLQLADQWLWEVKVVDGKTTYQKYGTADFNQLGL